MKPNVMKRLATVASMPEKPQKRAPPQTARGSPRRYTSLKLKRSDCSRMARMTRAAGRSLLNDVMMTLLALFLATRP